VGGICGEDCLGLNVEKFRKGTRQEKSSKGSGRKEKPKEQVDGVIPQPKHMFGSHFNGG
jgi:hypothetical protein